MRGICMSKHSGILKDLRRSLSRLEQDLSELDTATFPPSQVNSSTQRLAILSEYRELADREILYLSKYPTARRYGEGERPGRTLAHTIRPSYHKSFITVFQTPDGTKIESTVDIRDQFLKYYSALYATSAPIDDMAQEDLSEMSLSYLGRHMQDFLPEPFSVEEISNAIDSLRNSSAPGSDGFAGEFYKAFKDLLAPKLLEVYDEALEKQLLPPTLREAIIILFPKPGKDPSKCESYRPLSLLNLDYKILAKMIALRMAQLMEFIISPAQSGFVPRRSTSLNLCTLFSVLHRINPEVPASAVLLDAEKAFDSLEWPFLGLD